MRLSGSAKAGRAVRFLSCGSQDFGDQLVFRGGSGIVQIVLNAEVASKHEIGLRNNLKNATAGLGQIGKRPGQDKLGVFAAGEVLVVELWRQLDGLCRKRKPGAIDIGRDFVKAQRSDDLVVLFELREKTVSGLPGFRTDLRERPGFLDEGVVSFRPDNDFGILR